mgnify:CR=1 FL=1
MLRRPHRRVELVDEDKAKAFSERAVIAVVGGKSPVKGWLPPHRALLESLKLRVRGGTKRVSSCRIGGWHLVLHAMESTDLQGRSRAQI